MHNKNISVESTKNVIVEVLNINQLRDLHPSKVCLISAPLQTQISPPILLSYAN